MSSSAQLVLLPWLLGWEQASDRTTFGAGLHAGSCLGIGWVWRDDLRALSPREVAVLGLVSVPAAVAGTLAADRAEERFGRPPQLAALLAGAGALMWWVDSRHPSSERPVGRRAATLAALAQVSALVPGVSRAGATRTALRAAGVDREQAERFSLLMSLPITAGAAALTLARAEPATLRALGPALVAGTATAALAGAAAATAHRSRPGRPLTGAALYRLGLAAVVARRLSRKGAT